MSESKRVGCPVERRPPLHGQLWPDGTADPDCSERLTLQGNLDVYVESPGVSKTVWIKQTSLSQFHPRLEDLKGSCISDFLVLTYMSSKEDA